MNSICTIAEVMQQADIHEAETPFRRSGDSLRMAVHQPAIAVNASLSAAITMFQGQPDCRIIAVIDGSERPIGAIFERDVRNILFNPYGHALLANPGFGGSVRQYTRPCPIADAMLPIETLIDIYSEAGGSEGLILTHDGRYVALLPSQAILRLAHQRDKAVAEDEAARLYRMDCAIAALERDTEVLADGLTGTGTELRETAEGMAARTQSNSDAATTVAAGAEQTAQSMADAARRGVNLAQAADIIREQAEAVRHAASEAMVLVADGDSRSEALEAAAKEIDAVADLILKIGGKINLLALNAAIEAARAGASGRGFAVVASEVKALAVQTGEEASRIAARIVQVRDAVRQVTDGRSGIRDTITRIDAISDSISAAAQDQEQATHIIAAAIEQASIVSDDIRENVRRIGMRSKAAGVRASQIEATAGVLADSADGLRKRVSLFLSEVRAA